MRLDLRCTEISVCPSDSSGFRVVLEVADAEEAREQMLRGPDDAADDWPLAKRYGEVCDHNRQLQEECQRADKAIDQLIEERDRANDALQATHIAMGGAGEWVGYLRALVTEKNAAAKHLDDMLLRFAFDAGALGDEVVSGLGVDPWGTLADFRRAFGLDPTMSPEGYAAREEASDGEGEVARG